MAMFVPQSPTIRQKRPSQTCFGRPQGDCAMKQRTGLSLVLDRSIDSRLTVDGYTPTLDELPRRIADFGTLGEALDYAARGSRGMNFHDARGTLVRSYP
jgi:hypothetical protein